MDADPAGNQIIFDLCILLFFTLMNAFFAGAEMAVVSVNRNRIRSLAEEGNKKAGVIQGLFEDSTKFLSTIQVAITFAGFYSSASAASSISPVLGAWMEQRGIPYSMALASNGVTLLLMFFNLVFGELVPKRIALQKAEQFCMITVMPIHYISKILSPFIKLLSLSTKGVLKLLRMKTEDEEEIVTEEEIKAMLKMGAESGTVEDREREMINSVFSFDDKSARELMVPRREVFAINIGDPQEEILDAVLESRHSRILVYEETIDNVIGILHVRDVIRQMRKKPEETVDIRMLLREAFFVPDTKDADVLFRELQSSRRHMAVLVDEYGGCSGIITVEDLVEAIMGDIHEEDEMAEPEIRTLSDNIYLVDGSMLLEELNEALSLSLVSENYDTLSGYMIENLGYIPKENECAIVQTAHGKLYTEEVKDNRITRVRIEKNSADVSEK